VPIERGISVSELNRMVQEALRQDPRLRSVTVRGEVSGFKHYVASGHWYFALKDAEGVVNCVMFRSSTLRGAAFMPKDGDAVVVDGYVEVYGRQGTYQLYVTGLWRAGTGDLYARFEELKRRLAAEGLFDPGRKKPLPMLPRKVAVVTSPGGAVLHDIVNVSGMRMPSVPIVLIPTSVQGPDAGKQIARGIRRANAETDAEVVIVARGGGSAEDLWCFNEEEVVRAIAESRLPVVSGVGHEVDVTLCDLAADVRASTPSNAAEIVFPDRRELIGRLRLLSSGLLRAERARTQAAELLLRETERRLSALSPQRRITLLEGNTRLLRETLERAIRRRREDAALGLMTARREMDRAMAARLDRAAFHLEKTGERLRAISPLGVLERGYALVYDQEKRLLTRAADAGRHREMTVRFADGEIRVARKENPEHGKEEKL